MKKLFMSGVVAGALLASGGAQAQVQQSGFFGSIDGFYWFTAGSGGINSGNGIINGISFTPGDGWGGSARIGYRFDATAWDVAVGGKYGDLKAGKRQGGGVNDFGVDDAKTWNVDLEVGYNITGPGWGVRPFLGARYQRWKHDMGYHPDAPLGCCFNNNKAYGVGPRVGFDGTLNLAGPVSVFGGFDFSVLFGRTRSTGGPAVFSGKDSRTMYNFDGRIGLDWEIMPLVHLAAGYRLDISSGTFFKNEGFVPQSGRGERVEHGPFVRLAYNWGAPPAGASPMAPPPPAGKKSYIVFFDFDRAVITPTAATTIKQAAADAKAGKSTRLDVTGHADKSGGDAYNMALSLRRGNAVKDQLVREGIPAAQIAVVGRGESMPLVQTADGVREPQNRRVEIVLN